MRSLRITAVVTVIIGLVMGGVMASSGPLISHSVDNSRALNLQFKRAVYAVEHFRSSNDRLPNGAEFASLPIAAGSYIVEFMPDGFDQCDGDEETFRTVPPGSYVLAAWRGEWWECYASSSGRSTLLLNASDYGFSGNAVLDGGAFMFIAGGLAMILWIGQATWRRSARD
jgi:hypothetical protein